VISDIHRQGPLIECVLNVSEGRDIPLLDMISTAVNQVDGAIIIHRDIGYDAHRTVFTIAGHPIGVMDSIDHVLSIALDHINMANHHGAHPCTGALDVIPLVPIQRITIASCQELLTNYAKHWSDDYQLPLCYYGDMASAPDQVTLAQIRKGGYNQLKTRMDDEKLIVDEGPNIPHPQLGLSSCTVRPYMIAYNINLNTSDLSKAKNLAAMLRKERSTHLKTKDVRFLGWYMETYGCTQISTNIYDIEAVTMQELYCYVSEKAKVLDIECSGSELIGLTPTKGLTRISDHVEQVVKQIGLNSVSTFDPAKRVLERVLNIPIN